MLSVSLRRDFPSPSVHTTEGGRKYLQCEGYPFLTGHDWFRLHLIPAESVEIQAVNNPVGTGAQATTGVTAA